MMRLVIACSALLGVCLLPGSSRADSKDTSGEGAILFARSGALWRIPASGSGEPRQVVQVGADAISSVILAPDQASAIVTMAGQQWLIRLPAAAATRASTSEAQHSAAKAAKDAAALQCAGAAHFGPSSRNVACVGKEGKILLYHVDTGTSVALSMTAPYPHLSFLDSYTLALGNKQGLWAVPLSPLSGVRPRRLIAEAPSGAMLVAPDGLRAVAVYDEMTGRQGETPSRALFVFRLDGKGIRRRLLRDGEPLAWSQDSRWLLVQRGEEACIVRAAGGEYKCWNGYTAVAVAPDGSFALLAKPAEVVEPGQAAMELYKGALDGVSAARPGLLLQHVDGAAAWVP